MIWMKFPLLMAFDIPSMLWHCCLTERASSLL